MEILFWRGICQIACTNNNDWAWNNSLQNVEVNFDELTLKCWGAFAKSEKVFAKSIKVSELSSSGISTEEKHNKAVFGIHNKEIPAVVLWKGTLFFYNYSEVVHV